MTLDALKRLFTRKTLFRLDKVLSPRLMPILYALGLAAILLWAVSHLFWSFGYGFGNGLWGLLEIAVFGLLSVVGLRVLCEALLVWFKTHEPTSEPVKTKRSSASLLDEVREAIRDLADHGDEHDYAEADEYITPVTDVPPQTSKPDDAPRGPATKSGEVSSKPRRTAKRTPPTREVF